MLQGSFYFSSCFRKVLHILITLSIVFINQKNGRYHKLCTNVTACTKPRTNTTDIIYGKPFLLVIRTKEGSILSQKIFWVTLTQSSQGKKKRTELLHYPVGDGAGPCVHACHREVHRSLILHPKQVHHILVAL